MKDDLDDDISMAYVLYVFHALLAILAGSSKCSSIFGHAFVLESGGHLGS